jgi:hypothetical protein
MSKYDALWTYVRQEKSPCLKLTFAEIETILGFPIDHSFLRYKKELQEFGFQVGKISLKENTVIFIRMNEP